MVALLIASGVGSLATVGSNEYIGLAIMLALIVGIIQLGMGLFKLGFLVNFLSHPVIAGFTSAAALIIGLSQLKHLLGFQIPRSHYVSDILIYAGQHFAETNLFTLTIGLLAILLIWLARKFKWWIPGPLLAVLFGIGMVWLMGWHTQGVKIVGEIPQGLPKFSLPTLDFNLMKEMLPIALTISFIGFMESIAVAMSIQMKHKDYKIDPNQELVALGMSNIGGSLFQSFPTTGGFSRTAVNNQAGSKTGMSSIISAILIGLTLLFLTPLFYYLPNAILAAVIIIAVIGLIDVKGAIHLWKVDRGDFMMMIATFLGTLALGIEQGVLIGVVLSLALIIFRTTQPHAAVLGQIPGKPHYRNIGRFDDLIIHKEILIYRFDARLYFANSNVFKDGLKKEIKRKGTELKLVILDADSINGIDSSGIHAIEEILEHCKNHDLELNIVGLKGPIRDILYRSGFISKIGEENLFFRIQHAVDSYEKNIDSTYSKYVTQREKT